MRFTKTSHLRLPRGLVIATPRPYLSLVLGPSLANAPPVPRTFDRPPPLGITYGVISKTITHTFAAEYTAHTFRNGAVLTLLANSAPVHDVPPLTAPGTNRLRRWPGCGDTCDESRTRRVARDL